MQLLQRVTQTNRDLTPVILRVALGLVIFPHGAQKLLGWFGGYGFGPTVEAFQSMFGLPPLITTIVVLVEFFGGLALIFGAFSRVAAIGIASVMLGAVATVHAANGFFMNWTGSQAGEGFEYHVLALGLAIAVALLGSGAFSLDRVIAKTVER